MSDKFYNYDTRGASPSDQIIWLEKRVKQLEAIVERQKETISNLRGGFSAAVELMRLIAAGKEDNTANENIQKDLH